MYKRKIMGILKYGTRDTHPQNTGFSRRRDCSCFKAYGETILMSLCYYNKRLHKLLGFARQVEKRHLHQIKNRYFGLEGGLPFNDAINSITAKSQEDYYNKGLVKKDGQVPMKDRLSFKRLLMKAEDLRKSSYRSDKL
jgi:hypothetical protein